MNKRPDWFNFHGERINGVTIYVTVVKVPGTFVKLRGFVTKKEAEVYRDTWMGKHNIKDISIPLPGFTFDIFPVQVDLSKIE